MRFKSLKLPQVFFSVDLKIYQKYPSRILFSIFQIFLMIFLFFYISETIGSVPLLKMEYFPFVATGLSFQYFFSGIVNGASEKLEEYRDYGVLEELLFGRFPAWWIMLSAGFHEMGVALIKSLMIMGAVAFSFNLDLNFFWLLPTLFISFFLGLGLSFIASCSFLLWKRFSLLEIGGTLITLFLSGVYFPVSVLPAWVQAIAQWNPLLHCLNLFRQSLGMTGEVDLAMSVSVLLGSMGLVLVFNGILYRFVLQKLKADGISAHF